MPSLTLTNTVSEKHSSLGFILKTSHDTFSECWCSVMVLRPEKGRDVAFTSMHSVNSGIKGSNHYSFVSLCPGVMYLFSVGTTRLLQAVSDKPLSDSNRHFVSTIKKLITPP